MSNIALVANIARGALAAQSYGMDVTAHNIANVNTEGYSRQNLVLDAKDPSPMGGLLVGRGVDASQIIQVSDQLIENQLNHQRSEMYKSEAMTKYMKSLEDIFSEYSESNVGSRLTDFWNLWHDLSNNPAGTAERAGLYENSIVLTAQFNELDPNMNQMRVDLTQDMSLGTERVNQLTAQIASVNSQIATAEVNYSANDLRDQRNSLIAELAGYVDIHTFEQSNGAVTVLSVRGSVLVQESSSYDITMGGADNDRVEWQGSSGGTIDLTDHISVGKLGGWLEVRDEILARYKLNLDSVSKEFIWVVNQQHSQGVGSQAFPTVTGTYAVSDSTEELGTQDSGLAYYNKITDGTFKLWVYDAGGAVAGGGATTVTIDADAGGTTLAALGSDIDGIANITATVTSDGALKIDADSGYTLAFSDDTSNVLASLGINTFFAGTGAGDIDVSASIRSNRDNVAAARIETDGTFTKGDNRNALAITDLQYAAKNIAQWSVDRKAGSTEGSASATIEDYYHTMIGSIGITSDSISRRLAFNESMFGNLSGMRDDVSAVSLDEEMSNLMKYQHAYTAAAKLLNVVDEMLRALLEVK